MSARKIYAAAEIIMAEMRAILMIFLLPKIFSGILSTVFFFEAKEEFTR